MSTKKQEEIKKTDAKKKFEAAIAEENIPSVPFWRTLFPYLTKYKAGIIIAVICSFLTGIAIAIQPLIIKYIVDSGLTPAINGELAKDYAFKLVLILTGAYIVLGIFRVLIWRLGFIFMLNAQEGALLSLRSQFFYHIQHLCMRFSEKNASGEIFNYIMGSPMGNIKSHLHSVFMSVPYQIIAFVISLAALTAFSWKLTAIMLVTVVVMILIKRTSDRKIKRITREFLQVEKETSSYITDMLHGMDAIKMYSIEDQTGEKFNTYLSNMKDRGVKQRATVSMEAAKPELVQYLGTAVVYIIGGLFCLRGEITTGVLYAFLSSMASILSYITSWLNIALEQGSAEVALNRIMHIINQKSSTPEIAEDRKHSIEIERESAKKNGKPCISLQNVTFAYDERNQIFNNLSCDIGYNESVALVGSSGSGKSTLTKLIMRLYEVNEGSVKVHGRDVRDFATHDLRLSFGVVPQNPFIFHDTVWDNIRVARPDASNYEIIKAMEIAHVHEFVNNLPMGWATVIGDGALNLSGGQKQRIAIARAILKNPDILIFDEATSALDNISERHIQQAMEELMKTHTVIIVAHRLSTIKNVDRILVFHEGEIVQEGTYDSLAEQDGLFRELLEGPTVSASEYDE